MDLFMVIRKNQDYMFVEYDSTKYLVKPNNYLSNIKTNKLKTW